MTTFRLPLTVLAFALALLPLTNSQAAPCATLVLESSPDPVAPGGAETLSGSITSCAQKAENLTITYVVEGPCDFSETYALTLRLKPGQTHSASITRPAPDCSGTYTIRATATTPRGKFVTSAFTSFTVQ